MEFASSSFLTSEPHFIHDVFINFGGEDIGRRFVSHLHSVLLQNQVKTFISQENLHEGMKLEEHMRAIGHTKITIIVFSKSYAESIWCLLELEKIIECDETFGQIVLPLFYEIDPSDVRHQKDDFGKALEEAAHKSYSGEQLEHALSKWSRALTTAARITGWDFRNFRHDAELVERIVSHVKTLLDYKDLSITQYPVGLESQVEDVIKCIENESSKVCMIGIWGMGGSGRTTLAKAIYNRIYREFIGKSFIENIGEVWDSKIERYVALQENLLSDVLKSKLEVKSVGIRRTMIQNGISRKKLLIVLDDVNEIGQLKSLCGSREWFGQGTVIILTTRDKHLLNQHLVDYVYQMDRLNENESLELFSWHAFRDAIPKKEWSELARNVIVYCRGLPLALQFLGSYLCDKTIEVWESVLRELQRNPPNELLNLLNMSFDGLRDTEKDIFLDVCCFFKGKEKDYVTEILNGCGLHADIGITLLIDRGLIKVERNNKLELHPLLRDMGRQIIHQECSKEPGKRSRLWLQDDVKDVLNENTGTEAIQGLSLKLHSRRRDGFEAHAFKKMKRLRLLQLDHVQLSGDFGNISEELRWICWRGFPYEHIPSNFHLQNAIAIDLKHSHLQLLWKQPPGFRAVKIP
ncbi:TMV resistance protein N-like [Vigna radiata var. radiata]|uniref:TMV resistance protein N-like n=1 Tax=Vigna radiata var. radiata TaxID=3916 RepID=A0A1S3VB99_VIGRR|nr:TMV resistance protein N-like [Vigna radiata var. radiata]